MSLFGRSTAKIDSLDPTRCQIFKGVSSRDLRSIVNNERIKTVQFVEPLARSEIENLETILFSKRPDITLRVYGHYDSPCDLSFLATIPSVEKVSADCLFNAVGVDAIANLSNLKELSIGIFNLESFDFLHRIPSTITKLGLYLTFSKKPSISALARLSDLEHLYLEGQQKGIEAIKELSNLETIVLRSISTKDLSYLEGLEKLWSVDIKLGGIKNFDSLVTLPKLKYLELWQIRGLGDLSFISEIVPLQNLFIQSLKQVTRLPSFENSHQLRRVYLENLKGLKDLTSLEFAPSLTEFCYVLAGSQKPEDLLPVLRNKNVRSVLCGFGNDKTNELFDQFSAEYGKQKYKYSKFKYV